MVIVSREAINVSSPIVSAAPCTTYREGRRIYPSVKMVLMETGLRRKPLGETRIENNARTVPTTMPPEPRKSNKNQWEWRGWTGF